ncbi:MAG TPA: effector binding domain-containing protein [Feifaniaceae bacterium]|nr:effector binding domain-containing protein [Feifaniaceae bacterium]
MDYRACIQNSVNEIESCLKEEITVERLAASAGFSPYHFYRVFQAYVGMPVMSYVRYRRLAHAAAELVNGKRVLNAALDWGFDTHAGFTRAFTKAFGAPPERYRLHGAGRVPAPVDLNQLCGYQLTGGIVMEPKIITRPAFYVAGYHLRTTSVNGENSKAIPAFWQEYLKNDMHTLHGAFTPVSHTEYGICMDTDIETGEFSYVIGVETADPDSVPEGFHKALVPAATYAVFTTPPSDSEGFVASIQGTWSFIYERWFPASGYEYAPGCADFELYDERCMGEKGKQIDIYIPVVKKA